MYMEETEVFMEEELAFELGFGNRQLRGRAHLREHTYTHRIIGRNIHVELQAWQQS